VNDSHTSTSEALDPARIRELMSSRSLEQLARLGVLEETDSTNSALQRLPPEQQHAHAILAESQTSGRGRRQRNWYSPAGCNVYLSLGWRFQDQRLPFAALPLVTAVCTCRALARAGLRGHGIKWPNDILADDAKIAGILVELQAAPGGPANAVIGVGVNVSMAQGEVRRRAADASIDRSWTDMESQIPHHANGVSRNEVAALLLEELLAGVLEYQSTGFSALRAEWTELDLLAGKEVRLDLQGKFTDGIARGISEDGALLLDVTGPDGCVGRQVIHAGEVSVHRD
jgi:BirA family biotin operon repressor/biotin-[acetyl-CoA-carboxylase] ligase